MRHDQRRLCSHVVSASKTSSFEASFSLIDDDPESSNVPPCRRMSSFLPLCSCDSANGAPSGFTASALGSTKNELYQIGGSATRAEGPLTHRLNGRRVQRRDLRPTLAAGAQPVVA